MRARGGHAAEAQRIRSLHWPTPDPKDLRGEAGRRLGMPLP
jgi:hypothetical protein